MKSEELGNRTRPRKARVKAEPSSTTKAVRNKHRVSSFLLGAASGAVIVFGLSSCAKQGELESQEAPPASSAPAPTPEPAAPKPKEAEQKGTTERDHEDRATEGQAQEPAPAERLQPPPQSAPKSAPRRGAGAAQPSVELPTVLSPDGRRLRLDEAARQLDTWRRDQGRALNRKEPDCPSAKAYRENICRLAERICKTSPEGPNTVSVTGYCDGAKSRCSEAKRRYDESCSQ